MPIRAMAYQGTPNGYENFSYVYRVDDVFQNMVTSYKDVLINLESYLRYGAGVDGNLSGGFAILLLTLICKLITNIPYEITFREQASLRNKVQKV